MQKEAELNQNVKDKMDKLRISLQKAEAERQKSSHTLSNINKTLGRIREERRASSYVKTKVHELYSTARQDARSETDALRKALADVNAARAALNERAASNNADRPKEPLRKGALMKVQQHKALTLPLWIDSKHKPAPALCGAVPAEPTYIAKVGDTVAALVKGQDGDENWILAEVSNYNSNTNKYEVEDIDEEQKEKHILSRKRVIPLPLYRANPESHPGAVFKKGTLVLALYPQTTCFYRAIVSMPPSTPTDEYQVLFEDTTYAEGYAPAMSVPQRYVLYCKEGKKK